MIKHNRFCQIAVFVLMGMIIPSRMSAQLNILPSFMFINEPKKSQQCVVRNTTDAPIEAWIIFQFGYPMMNEKGEVEMVFADSVTRDDRDASTWLHAFPQRFLLQPQGSQVVRLIVTPPDGLPDGEYFARVIVEEKRSRPVSPTRVDKNIRPMVEAISRIDVPIHYRRGRVYTGLVVRDAAASVEGSKLKIAAELSKTGNASYWGKMKLRLLDSGNKAVLTQERNIVVYNDLNFSTKYDVSKLTSGLYTLEVTIATQRSDIRPQFIIQAPSYATKMEVSVP